MPGTEQQRGVSFNNIRINSISSSAGVFAGSNMQHLWCSEEVSLYGFGTVMGESNTLDAPCSAVTDPGSSREMLKYFEEHIEAKMRKRGI